MNGGGDDLVLGIMYAFMALIFGSAALMGIIGALRHRGRKDGSDEDGPEQA